MKKLSEPKTGIRRKITQFIFLSSLSIVSVAGALGYFLGFKLMQDVVGEDHRKIAQLLGVSVSRMIDREIEEIKTYAINILWKNKLRESNLKYKDEETETIQHFLLAMDKKWIEAASDSPLMKSYLDNEISRDLRELMGEKKEIDKIFITDRCGGLVASSGKTSDFYQADERWWQEAFDDGRGKVFLGEVELDRPSDVLAIPIVVPIKDKKGNLLGICKAVISIEKLLGPLENFKIGKTGHAVLIDEEGYVLFHQGVSPLSAKIMPDEELQDLIESESKWIITDNSPLDKQRMFLACARIENQLLLKEGFFWRVFIDQEAQEVFQPLNTLFLQMIAAVVGCAVIWMFIGLVFSGRFAAPIVKLRNATERIGAGDLDYKIDIRTGDEIEELAKSFRAMVISLKEKQEEIQKWSKTLEKRVAERTDELAQSQKQTLDVMKDLQEAYDKLKATQDRLVQAEKMYAVGQLASGVAHEVKNPLGIIVQGVDYLEKEFPPGGKKGINEIVEMIRSNVERANNIVRALIDFSKKAKLDIKPHDINAVLENSLSLVRPGGKIENIKVIKKFTKDMPRTLVDKGRMEQVFINIFLNAIQAMSPKGGKLTIRTQLTQLKEVGSKVGRREGDYFSPQERVVMVEVDDTGAGISKENLKRIFDPFFTTKGPGEGSGLGLSVTKNIIDIHKGLIKVESKENKGTRITITLKAEGE